MLPVSHTSMKEINRQCVCVAPPITLQTSLGVALRAEPHRRPFHAWQTLHEIICTTISHKCHRQPRFLSLRPKIIPYRRLSKLRCIFVNKVFLPAKSYMKYVCGWWRLAREGGSLKGNWGSDLLIRSAPVLRAHLIDMCLHVYICMCPPLSPMKSPLCFDTLRFLLLLTVEHQATPHAARHPSHPGKNFLGLWSLLVGLPVRRHLGVN